MILCIGTTPTMQRTMIFDQVRIDDVNRAKEVFEYASGKSINVARVVKELGEKAAVAGFAGRDRGNSLREDLRGLDIQDWMIESGARTRLCTTVIDRFAGTATELIEESGAVEQEAWDALENLLRERAGEARVVLCTGSLAPGGPADFYARRVEQKVAEQTIILDGRGEVIRLALRYPAFILKINREELAATMEEVIDSDERLYDVARRTCPREGALIVTLGKAGALLCQNDSLWRIRIPAVPVVSAIGSGDAFAAGLAVGIAKGESLINACRLGAACGCANAMTARAGEVHRGDVQQLLSQIEIEPL